MVTGLRVVLSYLCVFLFLSCKQNVSSKEKPKYMWFDSEANFERFSNKDSIRFYLDKTKESDFNTVVIDVRGLNGYANYNSEILLSSRPDQDWDYLQFFIDESRKRGFEVCASAVVFSGDVLLIKPELYMMNHKSGTVKQLFYTNLTG